MRKLFVVAFIFLCISCKKNREDSTPVTPVVPTAPVIDTMALLTAHPWHIKWLGHDLDRNGKMDTRTLNYQLEIYTFRANGTACDSIITPSYHLRCGTWYFPGPAKSVFNVNFDTLNPTYEFSIVSITDTSMITKSKYDPWEGWYIYTKYP